MALTDLPDWIDEHSRAPAVWFVKRLQANDTLATGSHQAGPYLPKEFLFAIFPALFDRTASNPRIEFDVYVDSQGSHRRVQAIWYNNELRNGTRNETRITGFGGITSDLLDPESTGAVAVLAFSLEEKPVTSCHVWVCRDDTESDLIEDSVGKIDPTKPVVWVADGTPEPERFTLQRRISRKSAPDAASMAADDDEGDVIGIQLMPPIETLVRQSAAQQRLAGQSVDVRLLRRHERMLDLFDQAEELSFSGRVRAGFPDLRSLLEAADRIRRGRQARTEDALAFQLRDLLEEEGFEEGVAFSFRPSDDASRPPDFLFPGPNPDRSGQQSDHKVAMLYVEQTVRDRWQLIAAAASPGSATILTIQRGVSEAQFAEMTASNVTLVVPARLHDTYPSAMRGQLRSLESFLADVRHLVG